MVGFWTPEEPADLLERCQLAREGTGRIVGLVNGCFDLLHPGHVLFLQEAAQHCDSLVVAIDTDAQVRHAKADGRPVRSWYERAFLVKALACVFGVTPIDPVQPLTAVLEALRPDLYMYRPGSPPTELEVARGLGLGMLELGRHGAWSTTEEIIRCERRRLR